MTPLSNTECSSALFIFTRMPSKLGSRIGNSSEFCGDDNDDDDDGVDDDDTG